MSTTTRIDPISFLENIVRDIRLAAAMTAQELSLSGTPADFDASGAPRSTYVNEIAFRPFKIRIQGVGSVSFSRARFDESQKCVLIDGSVSPANRRVSPPGFRLDEAEGGTFSIIVNPARSTVRVGHRSWQAKGVAPNGAPLLTAEECLEVVAEALRVGLGLVEEA